MASFEPQEYGFDEPPPRPTTPPVRRGFLVTLFLLCLAATLVYGIPYMAEQTGYAWEAGRSRAAIEALDKLDKAGVINRTSELFRMATAAVAPAVVRIETAKFGAGGPLRGLPIGPAGRGGPGIEGIGLGSGVIIDKDNGYIVTNNHVIRDADKILVRLSDGEEVEAKLVGKDPKTDLAVLQVGSGVRVAARWGDSEKLEVGDWVLAIGSPYALDRTVTAGIISATERNDLRINEYESFIQTDAAINPGNSGGPLIDLSGKVVGINTAIYTLNQGNEGIGLAIPSSMARRVVESLIKNRRVVRGYLGVIPQRVQPAQAKALGLPDAKGALIAEVRDDSPAAKAGVQAGDVIVKLNGEDVVDHRSLRNQAAGLAIGSTVPVELYREGKRQTLQVTIAELPVLASFGFRVREVPGAGDSEGGLVIDQVVANSPAWRAGLRPGMRILGVGPTEVRTKDEYERAIDASDLSRGFLLRVRTPDGQDGTVLIGGPPPGRR
jgi:serine protease Do